MHGDAQRTRRASEQAYRGGGRQKGGGRMGGGRKVLANRHAVEEATLAIFYRPVRRSPAVPSPWPSAPANRSTRPPVPGFGPGPGPSGFGAIGRGTSFSKGTRSSPSASPPNACLAGWQRTAGGRDGGQAHICGAACPHIGPEWLDTKPEGGRGRALFQQSSRPSRKENVSRRSDWMEIRRAGLGWRGWGWGGAARRYYVDARVELGAAVERGAVILGALAVPESQTDHEDRSAPPIVRASGRPSEIAAPHPSRPAAPWARPLVADGRLVFPVPIPGEALAGGKFARDP
ncbi:hypothetical protein BDY21DRAFT_399563 [Lineolata rhizophorae]|uniref:Uncharacterized protein n=1 Tax=Lineolata rhizophorae TaxID=578093 RepID=A0A6A6NSN7_9PEZI|nr:hypothetical protein BDY21DRAFT_399563 [Lineolata rhizophorae]